MRKIYHLGTCSTCKRILKELDSPTGTALREIKTNPITEEELEEMRSRTDSYESLFSRRAMKFRQWGLNEKDLSEDDYKKYILEEYTFLKRPVIIADDKIFIGSSKKVVEAAKEALHG